MRNLLESSTWQYVKSTCSVKSGLYYEWWNNQSGFLHSRKYNKIYKIKFYAHDSTVTQVNKKLLAPLSEYYNAIKFMYYAFPSWESRIWFYVEFTSLIEPQTHPSNRLVKSRF